MDGRTEIIADPKCKERKKWLRSFACTCAIGYLSLSTISASPPNGFGVENDINSEKATEVLRAFNFSTDTICDLELIFAKRMPYRTSLGRFLRSKMTSSSVLSATGHSEVEQLSGRSYTTNSRNDRSLGVFLPNAISIVLWVQLVENESSAVLFGLFGSKESLTVATNKLGTPMVVLAGPDKLMQVDYAPSGAAKLDDGKAHCIVVTLNRSTGLLRQYIDGQPEAALVASGWHLDEVTMAFSVQPPDRLLGDSRGGAYVPYVIPRELSDIEIAQLKNLASAENPPWLVQEASAISIDYPKNNLFEFASTRWIRNFQRNQRIVRNRRRRVNRRLITGS